MKCRTSTVLIILFALTKIAFSSPVPEAKADAKPEPCFAFLFSLLGGLFKALSFGGYGGQLGPQFQAGYPAYYPGVYYGAPYYPYPYPYYPGPVITPGGPVIGPGGPVFVNPGGPVVVNPGGPIIVNPTNPTNRPIIGILRK